MWITGGIIGLILGASVGGSSALLGALLGAALGAWIGSSRQAADEQKSALAQRLGRLEGDLARLRWEVEALQELQKSRAPATSKAAAVTPPPDELAAAPEPQPAGPVRADTAFESPVAPAATLPARDAAGDASGIAAEPIELPSWLARFWAGNPLVKIGIVLLFFGVASGLRLAAEYGLLPVPVRLFLAAAAAIGLIGFGFAKVREDTHRVFGLSLQGGGFALLYLVAYFMLARYAMIGPGPAFVMFALLGVTCVTMAAKQDGPALAVLGLSGAFLAPVLAGGGSDSPLALFSYFALLNVFILTVDWFRAWRVLNVAGFVFTLAIGMAWGIDRYEDRHYLVTQLFLLMFLVAYSAMPVLTALFRAPGLNGWRDGMLIFGTPVVGSFLQARLMEGVPYGNAWSALIAAVWYALLWFALYRENEPENETVERSHLGLAIAFFTLSIPLAFGAQVTSALWAAEGCAVLWYGVRTRRLLPQMTGLLMQLAGGGALLLGWNELGHGVPVANDVVLGGALLAAAGIASSRMLRAAGDEPWVSPLFPFVWAMLWWLGVGLGEIDRFAPHDLHAPFGLLYLTATALLLEALAAWWAWPQVRAAVVLLLAALCLAPLLALDRSGHPLPGLMALAFPVALGVHYALLRRHERHGEVPLEALRHVGAFWLALLVLPGEVAWQLRNWAPGSGLPAFAVWGSALAGGIALAVTGARRGLWPFARASAGYVPLATLLPFCGLALLLPAAALRLSGDGSGLPYLPVINVFDLVQLAGMAAMLALTHDLGAGGERPARLLVAAIAFLWLSTLAARIAHAWGGVPFEFAAMMRSTLFQMLLTLFWTIVSITTMILASRRSQRELWFGGFALLGVVGAKLLLFDAAGRGTLMWTGTLIGVAVLVLAASYFAPLPPRAAAESGSGA
jgi:uncharacterized membrane protein